MLLASAGSEARLSVGKLAGNSVSAAVLALPVVIQIFDCVFRTAGAKGACCFVVLHRAGQYH